MKKYIFVFAAVVFFAVLLISYLSSRKTQNQNQADISRVSATPTILLGGDRDEHGCIPSAGYSWCEPKNKCLREWEEKCYGTLNEQIEALLAKKYARQPSEVKVEISKQNDSFAGGSVKFGEGGPGEVGMFLARKADGSWEIVFDGNGNVDCEKMRKEYGFPEEILKPNFCD